MSVKPTVAVAMSGGVDSSVTAALLQEQGYTVFGVMLNLWREPDMQPSNRCCTPEAMAIARRVASILTIPFYVLDARREFFDSVVKPFINDYAHNRTPNPCLSCNRLVRWGFLYHHALAAGANYLATGHYARIIKTMEGDYRLLRGVDPAKDQSYVLHFLTQELLTHTLFPLGEYTKQQVRQLAHHHNLPVADRPDSQDLCFVGSGGDYRHLLSQLAPETQLEGPIVDHQGYLLGHHQGLSNYTIGQRKGLHIASPVPLYVLEKDSSNNTLVVGPKDQLGGEKLTAINANWIVGQPPSTKFQASVKIRYKAQDVTGAVSILPEDRFRVDFENSLPDITPGQGAVLYNGDVCLGGGIIAD